MRILLVDDDKDLCALTEKALVKNGHVVDAFFDGQQGINHAKRHPPDLILMDIMLPESSGPELISALKADPLFKKTPVIFLTALVEGRENSIEDGGIMVSGVNYPTMGKPYEIDRLLFLIKHAGNQAGKHEKAA